MQPSEPRISFEICVRAVEASSFCASTLLLLLLTNGQNTYLKEKSLIGGVLLSLPMHRNCKLKLTFSMAVK